MGTRLTYRTKPSRLTDDDKARIRAARAAGRKYPDIAQEFGICREYARQLCRDPDSEPEVRPTPGWVVEAVRLRDEDGLGPLAISQRLGITVDRARQWLRKFPRGTPPPKPSPVLERDEPLPPASRLLDERPFLPPPRLVAVWQQLPRTEQDLVLRMQPQFRDRLVRFNEVVR